MPCAIAGADSTLTRLESVCEYGRVGTKALCARGTPLWVPKGEGGVALAGASEAEELCITVYTCSNKEVNNKGKLNLRLSRGCWQHTQMRLKHMTKQTRQDSYQGKRLAHSSLRAIIECTCCVSSTHKPRLMAGHNASPMMSYFTLLSVNQCRASTSPTAC